jgi:hypothetical protein
MAPSGARRCRASTTPVSVATSTSGDPSRDDTISSRPDIPGGTEYWLPRKQISACADTVRVTASTAGYGAVGAASSRSAAASSATVSVRPSRRRVRASPTRAQNRSRSACAPVIVCSSARVRHQRWAAPWLAFSTTPLRCPRRDGQIRTPAP